MDIQQKKNETNEKCPINCPKVLFVKLEIINMWQEIFNVGLKNISHSAGKVIL